MDETKLLIQEKLQQCCSVKRKLPTANSKQKALDVLNFNHENHICKSKGGQEENFKEVVIHLNYTQFQR